VEEAHKEQQPTVVVLAVAAFHSIRQAMVHPGKVIRAVLRRDKQAPAVAVQEPQVLVLRAKPVEQVEQVIVHLSQAQRHFMQQAVAVEPTAVVVLAQADPTLEAMVLAPVRQPLQVL
jgi:hypothetical protein